MLYLLGYPPHFRGPNKRGLKCPYFGGPNKRGPCFRGPNKRGLKCPHFGGANRVVSICIISHTVKYINDIPRCGYFGLYAYFTLLFT